MSDERRILRNVARRPIELHEGEAVAILPAGGTIEVAAVDARHAALIDRGLLTAHAAPVPPPAAPEPAPRGGKTPTETRRRKGERA
jgi:hypothetical protein